jgi:hypothetical protein
MTEDRKNFGAVFDAHTTAEFQTRDIDATMATMGGNPHVTNVPVMTGGCGIDSVRSFYETWFIGRWPEDVEITLVSRTIGDTQLGNHQLHTVANLECVGFHCCDPLRSRSGTVNGRFSASSWECVCGGPFCIGGTDCYWVEFWNGLILPGH